MKIPVLLLIVLFAFIFSLGVMFEHTSSKNANSIKFIWNDVEESIPVDGSLIRLEFTDGNNVYIGPAD